MSIKNITFMGLALILATTNVHATGSAASATASAAPASGTEVDEKRAAASTAASVQAASASSNAMLDQFNQLNSQIRNMEIDLGNLSNILAAERSTLRQRSDEAITAHKKWTAWKKHYENFISRFKPATQASRDKVDQDIKKLTAILAEIDKDNQSQIQVHLKMQFQRLQELTAKETEVRNQIKEVEGKVQSWNEVETSTRLFGEEASAAYQAVQSSYDRCDTLYKEYLTKAAELEALISKPFLALVEQIKQQQQAQFLADLEALKTGSAAAPEALKRIVKMIATVKTDADAKQILDVLQKKPEMAKAIQDTLVKSPQLKAITDEAIKENPHRAKLMTDIAALSKTGT